MAVDPRPRVHQHNEHRNLAKADVFCFAGTFRETGLDGSEL